LSTVFRNDFLTVNNTKDDPVRHAVYLRDHIQDALPRLPCGRGLLVNSTAGRCLHAQIYFVRLPMNLLHHPINIETDAIFVAPFLLTGWLVFLLLPLLQPLLLLLILYRFEFKVVEGEQLERAMASR
jgi:hypothetical protein